MADLRPHHRECIDDGVYCTCLSLFRRDFDERDDDATDAYRLTYDPDYGEPTDEPARRGRLWWH